MEYRIVYEISQGKVFRQVVTAICGWHKQTVSMMQNAISIATSGPHAPKSNYEFAGSARVARFVLRIFYAHIFNLNGKHEVILVVGN